MSILELLQHIVNEPAPKLYPDDRFPEDSRDFTDRCLLKDPVERPTPKSLIVSFHFIFSLLVVNDAFTFFQKHDWIKRVRSESIDMKAWAATV